MLFNLKRKAVACLVEIDEHFYYMETFNPGARYIPAFTMALLSVPQNL